eukprot:3658211-Prymnesium_polylepis.1
MPFPLAGNGVRCMDPPCSCTVGLSVDIVAGKAVHLTDNATSNGTREYGNRNTKVKTDAIAKFTKS